MSTRRYVDDLPSFYSTPPGTSQWGTTIAILVDGRSPAAGEVGPGITIYGNTQEESDSIRAEVLAALRAAGLAA